CGIARFFMVRRKGETMPGPLDGVRVIDITSVIAGPFATMILGDLVGKGPHSDKIVDMCQDVCEGTVMGNWDDFIVRETDKPT
ncbi:hypothetical protein C2W62_53945, partial [Candidatus Entotheonella serta]